MAQSGVIPCFSLTPHELKVILLFEYNALVVLFYPASRSAIRLSNSVFSTTSVAPVAELNGAGEIRHLPGQ